MKAVPTPSSPETATVTTVTAAATAVLDSATLVASPAAVDPAPEWERVCPLDGALLAYVDPTAAAATVPSSTAAESTPAPSPVWADPSAHPWLLLCTLCDVWCAPWCSTAVEAAAHR